MQLLPKFLQYLNKTEKYNITYIPKELQSTPNRWDNHEKEYFSIPTKRLNQN